MLQNHGALVNRYQVKIARPITESVTVLVYASNDAGAEAAALALLSNNGYVARWEVDPASWNAVDDVYVADTRAVNDAVFD